MILIGITVFVLLIAPALALVALLMALEARARARAGVAARQIRLTDAVHAELGAVVAPVVVKRPFQRWRVVFALPETGGAPVARLIAITDRVLAGDVAAADLDIVFTRPAPVGAQAA